MSRGKSDTSGGGLFVLASIAALMGVAIWWASAAFTPSVEEEVVFAEPEPVQLQDVVNMARRDLEGAFFGAWPKVKAQLDAEYHAKLSATTLGEMRKKNKHERWNWCAFMKTFKRFDICKECVDQGVKISRKHKELRSEPTGPYVETCYKFVMNDMRSRGEIN